MIQKLKNIDKKAILQNLRDVRFLGFMVFGVMVLLASWSGVRVIEANYVLQKQIAQLDQQNVVDQLENDNLRLKNDYYKTDTYLELQARKALGKGAPGETLILVPKDIALKYAKELPNTDKTEQKQTKKDKPTYRQNFDDWIDFIFHRNS